MSLVDRIRAAGVVGAGGAGFPAHVKAAARVEFILANGAECEPLMHKDAELMQRYADRVVAGVAALMEETGAQTGIIGLKAKHERAIEALSAHVRDDIRLHILDDFYPTGDEYVLVHAATGRLIPPGGIPLNVGVVVQNVETLYNIDRAREGQPVTHKFLTVAGAVRQPVSCAVPVGVTFRELLQVAGGATTDDVAVLVGGAMMGWLTRDLDQRVTKTTGGLIVLPGDHALIGRLERPEAAMHQIGKSTCDQCTYCTELCPRFLLGYDLQPHKVMRSLGFTLGGAEFWSEYGVLCCECGLCTLYACPEDLYPREACQQSKRLSREKQFSWPGKGTLSGTDVVEVHPLSGSRRIPLKNLVQRLGLTPYDVPAPLTEIELQPRQVQLPMVQHIGAPAERVVREGQRVDAGELVGEIPREALGARVHASIAGTVRTEAETVIIES